MYRYTLNEPNSNYVIYINLISSSAGHYLSRRPHVVSLIKELLSESKLRGDRVVIEQNMGRDIGTTDVVLTNDKDTIYYAQPIKSEVYSRFARNRFPQASNILTVILVRDTEGNYEVSDTWIGTNHPAFPGDQHETTESRKYWQTHALVQDAQLIQSKTVTKTCPY